MKINEIFYSLQGEGARAGEASCFIRLSGCDLACGFCDTEFESGKEMTDDELMEEVKKTGTEWVTWTGGEPMLQLRESTVDKFRAAGFKQSIETNGNHVVPFDVDWLVCSPKVAEHIIAKSHPEGVDELRYAWHKNKKSVPKPGTTAKTYFLSPICDGNHVDKENLKHCINLCLKNPQWRLSVQQHKIWKTL